MRIDISRPEGNTTVALGVAQHFLRQAKAKPEYIQDMARDVLNAPTAAAARRVIEERTGGAISFYDSKSPPKSGILADLKNSIGRD